VSNNYNRCVKHAAIITIVSPSTDHLMGVLPMDVDVEPQKLIIVGVNEDRETDGRTEDTETDGRTEDTETDGMVTVPIDLTGIHMEDLVDLIIQEIQLTEDTTTTMVSQTLLPDLTTSPLSDLLI